MLIALLALLLAAADPSPPVQDPSSWPADPIHPVIITEKSWIRRPTPEQLAAALPDAARQAKVGGRALMNCMVAYDGTLEDCQVVSETPPGLGFGAAARSMTGQFQLSPMVDGQSTTGGRMMVQVKFQPPV